MQKKQGQNIQRWDNYTELDLIPPKHADGKIDYKQEFLWTVKQTWQYLDN